MFDTFYIMSRAFEPLRKAWHPTVVAGAATLRKLQSAAGIPPPGKEKSWSLLALIHYWICFAATQLGNEIWFITFLPWSHWGFNQAIGRHLIPGWAFSLYVGQALKDTIQLPRPCPEVGVAVFDSHYAGEYGLPSTHTSNSIVLAGSLIFDAYQHTATSEDFWWITGPSIAWIVLCPYSRMVFGAHYPMDLVAGGVLGVIMLALKLAAVDPAIDALVLHGDPVLAAVCITAIIVLATALIPRPATPAYVTTPGDTTTVLGVMLGCTFGYLLRREQQLSAFDQPLTALGLGELLASIPLTLLGFGIAIGTKEAVKAVVRPLLVALLGERRAAVAGDEGSATAMGRGRGRSGSRSADDDSSKCSGEASNSKASEGRLLGPGERYEIELPQKLITYTAVGFASVYVAPLAFGYLQLPGRF